MSAKPWLARYTLEYCTRQFATRVSTLDGYSVATDGRTLIAVADGGTQEWSRDGKPTNGLQSLRDFVFAPTEVVLRTELPALWLWCHTATWDRCTECNGRGQIEADYDCQDCTDGRWLPSVDRPRPSYLGGVLISRSRLAWSLPAELIELDGIAVPVEVCRSPKYPAIVVLQTDRWRVVLMSIEPDPTGNSPTWPTFHPEPIFARLWIEQKDPATRLILADWLEEKDDPYAAVLRQPNSVKKKRGIAP